MSLEEKKLKRREQFNEELARYVERMKAGQGYIFFCAILTDELDAEGNQKISSHYLRSEFPAEDLLKEPCPDVPQGGPVRQLERFILNDLRGR